MKNIAKTFTFAAVAALAFSVAPTAKADDKGCSSITLRGTFAVKSVGFGVSAGGSAPFANVSTQTFDGNGNVTSAGMTSRNGTIVPVTLSGVYTVNPDCTGTYAVLNAATGFTAHYFFVIADDGNELQIICTDPGFVITCVARRIFSGKAI